MSTAHTLQLPDGALSALFGTATLVNGLVAVTAGVTSNFMVEHTETAKTPFIVAAVVLLVAAAFIASSWTENYGERASSAGDPFGMSVTATLRVISKGKL